MIFSKGEVNMKNIKENISKKTQVIPNNLEDTYEQIEKQENISVNLAEKMKLKYSIEKVSDTNIHQDIVKINENMKKINAKVQKSDDELQLNKTSKKLEELEDLTNDNSIKTEHTSVIKESFEKSFDSKIQELIKSSKISVLKKEKTELQEEKYTFFEKLLGKEKLKNAKIDNIDLKMQLLTDETSTKKLKHSLEDSLSDLYAYSECELGRDLTSEMKQLLDVVKTDDSLREMINWKQLRRKYKEKVSSDNDNMQLIPLNYKKESIRNKVHKLEIQNNDIKTQMQNNRASRIVAMQNKSYKESNNEDSLSKFKNVVDTISLYTNKENE